MAQILCAVCYNCCATAAGKLRTGNLDVDFDVDVDLEPNWAWRYTCKLNALSGQPGGQWCAYYAHITQIHYTLAFLSQMRAAAAAAATKYIATRWRPKARVSGGHSLASKLQTPCSMLHAPNSRL